MSENAIALLQDIHEESRAYAREIQEFLPSAALVYVQPDGTVLRRGKVIHPEELGYYDVIHLAASPRNKELLALKRKLDHLGVTYTTENADVTLRAHHPLLSSDLLSVSTPRRRKIGFEHISFAEKKELLREGIRPPYVVRSVSPVNIHARAIGSDHDLETSELVEVSPEIILEEFIEGRTVWVLGLIAFRNERLYLSFPIERTQYGFDVARLTEAAIRNLFDAAITTATELDFKQYALLQFKVLPDETVVLIKANVHPETSEVHPFKAALGASGISLKEFIAHVEKVAKVGR